MTQRFDLVPTALAVQAMRDSGYQNTAYAVAELIDNSLQAGATQVELLCKETRNYVSHRERWTIQKVAVLDNGSGMEVATLRMALQFGNGTRLADRTGIGRFGMGLPSASISQCTKVEVWSWTSGPESAFYTHIDLNEVINGTMVEVPTPVQHSLPSEWTTVAKTIGRSGTLVVWSDLDRCMWKNGTTIIKRSEFLIGRMYRVYINSGRATIRMVAFDDSRAPRIDEFALANDPGYLMAGTSTPEPFENEPMFEKDGDHWLERFTVPKDGTGHLVTVRYSIASNAARNPVGKDPGNTGYGKHAARNVGISLMRAGRELQLEQSLIIAYDPRERWWGVEIDFPPELDEIFGVTNNKQCASNFTTVAQNFYDLLTDNGLTEQGARQRMEEDGDPAAPLVEIIGAIQRRLRDIRNRIKVQRANARGNRKKSRYGSDSAEIVATTATKELQGEGRVGTSDKDEQLDFQAKIDSITEELVEEEGLTEDEARAIAQDLIESQSKYLFTTFTGEGSSFFSVKQRAGEILIRLNKDHPAYENLIEVLEEIPEDDIERDEIMDRFRRARRGLKLLLMAWARYEDETQIKADRQRLQDSRQDWGSVARKFLENN
jgi:hypothetical protein